MLSSVIASILSLLVVLNILDGDTGGAFLLTESFLVQLYTAPMCLSSLGTEGSGKTTCQLSIQKESPPKQWMSGVEPGPQNTLNQFPRLPAS